jgi:methionine-rich copper-binding protein CopC
MGSVKQGEETMKTRTRQLFRLAIIVAVGLMLPALLKAHAQLQKTQPAAGETVSTAPPHIQLWFDEEVDVKVSKIELIGPSGKVTIGPTHTMDQKSLMADITGKLANAAYTVNWQTAAAADGHVSKGDFKFTLKQATH